MGSRRNILELVTTPLGFFTLGLLIIEGILGTLSVRASESNLTILIVGMLIGFALLCAIVFVMGLHPRLWRLLVGVADISPIAAIKEMQLTQNDIRVTRGTLHALAYNLGNFLRTLATPEPIKDSGVRPNASENGQISPPAAVRGANGGGSRPRAHPYCQNAAKAQQSTPVRGSSGESRLSLGRETRNPTSRQPLTRDAAKPLDDAPRTRQTSTPGFN